MKTLVRILVVEDSEPDALLLIDTLEQQGFEPNYRRVQTEVEMERALLEEWDVVVSDYTLPGFDALGALRLIRAKGLDVPLIIVSGSIDERTALSAMNEGAVDYVLKDRMTRLGSAVTRALAQNNLHRKNRQAEREIQRQAAFAHFNPEPVLEFSAEGEIKYCNDATREMTRTLGYTDPAQILPAEVGLVVRHCLLTDQPRLRLENQLNGRTISWSFFPVKASHAVHCYGGDITERLQLEQQLRQSQKMEAVGQLSGGIAHDFNNLLTVIMGNLSLVQTSGKVAPENVESLEEIAHAAGRAANLTRQLLTFSRQQVIHLQDLDLNEVVDNISKMVRRLLGENVAIELGYASHTLPVHADPGMLEQVILNLCINARDAMPRGGRLSLKTAVTDIEPNAARRDRQVRPGRFARLSVTDTGTGISAENLRHVFEPFFTTKEVGKGTGLGLATVYGIVQQHNGWVTVDSELGRGSTFQVHLPLLATPKPKSNAPMVERELPRGAETILLVEDDIAVQMVAKTTLTRLGYRVLLANNGTEAIRIWHKYSAEIQLMLTDMVMPEGISGKDLARRFKADVPNLRIILMSGYNSDIAGTNFPQAGAGFFLGKPFEIHRLAEAVRSCLDMPATG